MPSDPPHLRELFALLDVVMSCNESDQLLLAVARRMFDYDKVTDDERRRYWDSRRRTAAGCSQ